MNNIIKRVLRGKRDKELTEAQWWAKLRREAHSQRERDEIDLIFTRHYTAGNA